ncbi:MAG: phenylalanine--tRNA ligase subunit alpha, partial [Endomicrobia bacterium]|nr:phenylalanine--tRNA ligase subunit alpha [Endomicrobiia bacterium]
MNQINKDKILQVKQQCLTALKQAKSINDIEKVRVKYFGRKGIIKDLFNQLKNLPLEERKIIGKLLNDIVNEIEQIFQQKVESFKIKVDNSQVRKERSILELSLPGVDFPLGKKHPLQQVYEEIIEIFSYLGFDIKYGPEIEFEDYNFTMLNIPFDHPARDMQDTLYLSLPETDRGKMLLRTHTSPV